MPTRGTTALAAWLMTSASALACRPGLAERDAPETVVAALATAPPASAARAPAPDPTRAPAPAKGAWATVGALNLSLRGCRLELSSAGKPEQLADLDLPEPCVFVGTAAGPQLVSTTQGQALLVVSSRPLGEDGSPERCDTRVRAVVVRGERVAVSREQQKLRTCGANGPFDTLMFHTLALSAMTVAPTRPVDWRSEASVPEALAGTWEVADVLVDHRGDGPRIYKSGDPRLVGRSLLIEQGRVRLSFGQDLDCRQVHWPRRETTWGALFEASFRRVPPGARTPPARPTDFGLTVRRKQPVAVYSLCPPVGAPAPLDEGQWVIVSPTGELLFREDPQYLLRLVPRAEGARPSPTSFECIRARTSTQKAICMSFELASWDRSVERALDDFVEARPERKAELELSQLAYLKRRESCGVDLDCIEQEEMSRVGELLQLKRW